MGNPALLGQVVIDDTNKWIDYLHGTGSYETEIPTGTYDDMHAVCAALVAAMDVDCPAAGGWNASVGTTGRVTIDPTNTSTFSLYWWNGNHGADVVGGNSNTNIGLTLGFDTSADDTGAYTYTSDNQHMFGWYPDKDVKFDSYDRPRSIGPAPYRAQSGRVERVHLADHWIRQLDIGHAPASKVLPDFADTNEDWITFWRHIASGYWFTYYSDVDTWTNDGQWALLVPENAELSPGALPRVAPGAHFYGFQLDMQLQE